MIMRTDERLKKISDDIINDITKTYPPTADGSIIIKPEQIEVGIFYEHYSLYILLLTHIL